MALSDEKEQAMVNFAVLFKILHDEITIIQEQENKRRFATKERFSIFSSLTRHHLEELHSNFISYLLNPSQTHDCETLFLEEFLKIITNKDATGILAKIAIHELAHAKVTTEKHIDYNEKFKKSGRIDIFIEFPSTIIIIENKIYAGEQSDQIERYGDYTKPLGKPVCILYLTLRGSASQQKTTHHYTQVAYHSDINQWLENCITRCMDFPAVSSGLSSYRQLINNLINKSQSIMTLSIKDFLLKKENLNFLKHLKEINAATEAIRNELRVTFFETLYEYLKDDGYHFVAIDHIVTGIPLKKIWDDKYRGLKLVDGSLVLKISDTASAYFCIEHDWFDIYYGLVIIDDNSVCNNISGSEHFQIANRLNTSINNSLNGSLSRMENVWFAWRLSYLFEKKLNDDDINYTLATENDVYAMRLKNEIVEYLQEWKKVISSERK